MEIDFYKVLGTAKGAVENDYMTYKKRSIEEEDEFIRGKYKDRLREIEMRQELAKEQKNQDKWEELERKKGKVEEAYQKLKTAKLRKEYNEPMTANNEKIILIYKRKSPYKVLGMDKNRLRDLTYEEIDQTLKNKRDVLIDQYSKDLASIPVSFFSSRQKMQLKIDEVEEAYREVATKDKRKELHKDEYDPHLINSSNPDKNALQGKIIQREEILSEERLYKDEENRLLRVKKTGKLKFQNWTGVGQLFVDEYEVKRIINGQEKVNTIYTNSPSVSINEKTGEPVDPDYYDCFINKLLAETTIGASKSMGGFVGGIEQNQAGEYYITLENIELSPMEKEQMAAVMIWKQTAKQKEKSQEREVM